MGKIISLFLCLGNMSNLSPEKARQMLDFTNGFVAVIAIFVIIVKIVFAVLLFVLVIKAIRYFSNKNKQDCNTCIYKQNYNQQHYKYFPPKDG